MNEIAKLTKGHSLEHDLRLLINNPMYSDIKILCKDEITLHGCRAILAARSEVFDALLYNGMKESYEKQISFPTFNSSGMEIILEYIYTGVVKEESLTKDNIVEAFNAADYFQLSDLQDFILKTVKITLEENYNDNYSPELLSKIVDTMLLTEDNVLFNLLIEAVSIIPLYNIEFGRLTTEALQILLSRTFEREKTFATLEYEVFRYSTILVTRQISDNATKILLTRLPTLENVDNSKPIDSEIIPDHQKIAKKLKPLIKFIDFKRIKGQILVNIIEPLNIIPPETILNVYRHNTLSNNTVLNEGRGFLPAISFDESDCVWDEIACGSTLLNNGKVVQAQNLHLHQNVRAKVALENKGVYEWDVIIEKHCILAWVGVCASNNFDYEKFAGYQSTAWVLGSSGDADNSGNLTEYCPSFEEDNIKVTVHLDMNKRTCAFTVNGTRFPIVSEWKNLPSKLYPVVSLKFPGQFRIQPHRKFD